MWVGIEYGCVHTHLSPLDYQLDNENSSHRCRPTVWRGPLTTKVYINLEYRIRREERPMNEPRATRNMKLVVCTPGHDGHGIRIRIRIRV